MRASLLLATLLTAAPALDAGAAVRVTSLQWQEKMTQRPRYYALSEWNAKSDSDLKGRRRVVVELLNTGDKAADGVVFRYAVQAKLAPTDPGRKDEAAVWMPPFQVGDRRVPRIEGLKSRKFPIADINLKPYLMKIRQTGFWPVALKVTVMVYPSPSDKLSDIVTEAELPIRWK